MKGYKWSMGGLIMVYKWSINAMNGLIMVYKSPIDGFIMVYKCFFFSNPIPLADDCPESSGVGGARQIIRCR